MSENKKNILFVDDELKLLSGLKRSFHSMRNNWNMDFISSGKEALELMEKKRYAVIVTDMRMPEMDGNELLRIVKEKYPDTVRIVLSGHSEEEAIIKSLNKTHVYLSKPCDPNMLKASIERATSLREFLSNKELVSKISDMDKIPSLPILYEKLVKLLQSPNSTMKDISEIIAQDMGMVAKVLQLVNSAYFGLSHQITSLTKALNYLGVDVLMSLVLTVEVFSTFELEKYKKFNVERLWQHSMNTGLLAKAIIANDTEDERTQDDAFVGGLLHDIGKTILMSNYPDEYLRVTEKVAKDDIDILDAEKQELGATHDMVGAYILSLWGLPDVIIEGVAFHHTAKSAHESLNCSGLVYAANVLECLVWEGKENIFKNEYSPKFAGCYSIFENPDKVWDVAKKIVFGSGD